MGKYRITVDTGGTFSHVVYYEDSKRELTIHKLPSTPHDPSEAILGGVIWLLDKGVRPDDIEFFCHGTTVGTNALLEGKGAKTGLLVTEGFRDVLHIRNEHRYEMYDPQIEFADPLVPSDLTFGVAERSTDPVPHHGWWHGPPTTFPHQGWISAHGLTVGAPGLPEAEVTDDGTIAVTLLRAVGYETNDEIAGLFSRLPQNPEHPYLANTLEKDTAATRSEALVEVYKRLRPGDPPTGDNARSLVENLFFNARRYDLGRVGRYKFTQRLKETASLMNLELPGDETRTLTREDLAAIVGHLIIANEGGAHHDVTDHLGNRRVRANGELIQNAFRVGLLRMERVIKERMTIQEDDKATPSALVNVRPVVASMKEFFGGSQLSQFMDQTNPLAELTSKRRLSALGPGGLSRERAGFDVRDVHHSHYGRICPIETPEGPNIGLIGSLATFGRVNDLGFIETPYRVVKNGKVTDQVDYLTADDEDDGQPEEEVAEEPGGQ